MGGGTRGWLREGPERRWPGGGGVGGSVGALSIRVVRGKSRITASLGRDASGHLSRLTALWVNLVSVLRHISLYNYIGFCTI